MKIAVQDLTGAALDWAVAQVEGPVANAYGEVLPRQPHYSADPACSFPIIEKQRISWDGHSYAVHSNFKPSPTGGDVHPIGMRGPNYLVAALRCHVAVRLGMEVEVPDELV